MVTIRWKTGLMLFWALSAVVGAPQLVAQQDSAADSTQQRLDDLDQQVKVLSRRWELYQDSVINAAKSRPSVTAGATGFQLKSADGNFVLKLRGYLQTDARVYLSDDAQVLTNDLLLRRVRPILEGTVYKYYDFRIMPDFAGAAPTIFDAYFEARFKPEFAVRAGKYKPALGLERYQSATDVKFIERGLPTNLVPSRDVGLQVAGDLAGGVLNYNAAIFDGVPDLASGLNDVADGKDLVGRLFIVPFAKKAENPPVDLGFGIAASTGDELGNITTTALPSYRSPGQATVFRYLSEHYGARHRDRHRRRAEGTNHSPSLPEQRSPGPARGVRHHPPGGGSRHRSHPHHGEAGAQGVAGGGFLLPDRREELLPQRYPEEAVRSVRRGMGCLRAGRALWRAGLRRRRVPDLCEPDRRPSPRRRPGPSASTGTSAGT